MGSMNKKVWRDQLAGAHDRINLAVGYRQFLLKITTSLPLVKGV